MSDLITSQTDFYLTLDDGIYLSLPYQPDSVVYNRVADSIVEYNLAGELIARTPYSTGNPVEITISGLIPAKPYLYLNTEAFSSRKDSLFLPSGQFTLKTAEEVANIFESYFKVVAEKEKSSDIADLAKFVDLQRGISISDCLLSNYTISRSTSESKFGFRYTLNLRGFATKKSPLSRGDYLSDVTRTLRNVSSQIAVLKEQVTSLSDKYLTPIQNVISELNRIGDLSESLVNTSVGVVYQAKFLAVGVISAVLNIARLGGLSNEILRLGQVLTSNPFLPQQAMLELASAWSVFDKVQDEFSTSVDFRTLGNALETAYYDALTLIGYVGLPQGGIPLSTDLGSFINTPTGRLSFADFSSPSSAPALRDDLQSTIPYTLRLGETLFDVARNVSGDVSQWSVIATFNGWASAYEKQDGTLASAGDVVRVPVELDLLSGVRPISRDNPLMSDLKLSSRGDFEINNVKSDLSLVRGEDNFIQAISNRLKTRVGELPYAPTYGLSDLIGSKLDEAPLGIISIEVADQLLSDERVISVKDATSLLSSQGIDVKIEVTPINSETLSLSLPIL